MLTQEVISANESLKGLSEEQISAIVTLSKNDEDVVIGKRISEIYNELDKTILETTGIEREMGANPEKTYNYLRRATSAYAAKFGDYDAVKSENERLKGEIAKGASEEIKGQLVSAQNELNKTKEMYNTLKGEFDALKESHERETLEIKIDNEIAMAKEGIKFKQGLNEIAMNSLIANAIAKVKAKNPTFVEGTDGKQRLVFKDENGVTLNNPENQLNPFTCKELLVKEFSTLGILDERKGKGNGGKDIVPPSSNLIGGATNQAEAMKIISDSLLAKGYVKGTETYQAELNKMWDENHIANLPTR